VTIEGVDFSFSKPTGAELKAAGKHFACRYLKYRFPTRRDENGVMQYVTDNGKGIDSGEVSDLFGHGISIVLNFEWYAGRMKEGWGAGVHDAIAAKAAAENIGAPSSVPIYFSADYDTIAASYPSIDSYLKGAASILGAGRIGIYGEYLLLKHCRDAGTARWFWQTYAWSGGNIGSSFIHLLQYNNGEKVGGNSVDLDRAYRTNYGQWSPIALPDTSTEEPVGISLKLASTGVSDPAAIVACHGTATVVGAGHDAIGVADGKAVAVNMPDGKALGTVELCYIADPAPAWATLGEKCVTYNVNGEQAVSPLRDVKFVAYKLPAPVPAPAPDCTSAIETAVTAATAPLNTTITGLKAQVATQSATIASLDSQVAAAAAGQAAAVEQAIADTKSKARIVPPTIAFE
jgi:hypothetical protein